jgi:hypothetical protein
MSVTPEPNVDPNVIERARRHVTRLAEEVAHLSETELGAPEYYAQLLQRVLAAFAAPAGAIWLRTPQGNLQLQYQINMREVGLDRGESGRLSHDELLRQAVTRGQAGLLPPHSGLGEAEGGKPAPGNPTDFFILLVPIHVEKQIAGLIEVWQDPKHGPDAQRGYLQFLVRMASFASGYLRNQQLRQMSGQQQVWTQLEVFARQIHASLHPTEVAYLVANEGRRLVECDRISVAVRHGGNTKVEAVSGADIVEKRSNLVRRMKALFDSVLTWGEKLVYSGTKDDSLPPKVVAALDAYLTESNSKLLVVLPLRDEREEESKKPPRSALLLESFEPPESSEHLMARLEVVGRHAAPALYNAVEHRRIPMRILWLPLAKLQEGLGGKARAILTIIGVALVALVALMVLVPYPLKMDANGQLLPIDRAYVYTPYPGHVIGFAPGLKPSSRVGRGQEIVLMRSLDLGAKIRDLTVQVDTYKREMDQLNQLIQSPEKQEERASLIRQLVQAEANYHGKSQELRELRRRTNASLQNPGDFWLRSPKQGIILSSDFRDTIGGRFVKEDEQLLRVGYVNPKKADIGDWEVELKIPQKHVGQVLAAFPHGDPKAELWVDLLLVSEPTHTFKGKLARAKIASQASLDRNTHDEPEPMVLAWVRVAGSDIPAESQLPPERLLTGTEVHARIRCGNHAMGYSLFYGVWEFLYEKVLFAF